jgi:CheY-like chemotaxis protein
VNDPQRRKILIVDDQPMLCKAICRMLVDHEVTMVGGAREALDKIEGGERYHVVLTDVMMPEISGMELYSQVTRLAPDQADKFVFMTGGAFTSTAREFFEHVRNPTIEKPFDRAALLAVIDDFLR